MNVMPVYEGGAIIGIEKDGVQINLTRLEVEDLAVSMVRLGFDDGEDFKQAWGAERGFNEFFEEVLQEWAEEGCQNCYQCSDCEERGIRAEVKEFVHNNFTGEILRFLQNKACFL